MWGVPLTPQLGVLLPGAQLPLRHAEGEAVALLAAADAALVGCWAVPAVAVLEHAGVPGQAQAVVADTGRPPVPRLPAARQCLFYVRGQSLEHGAVHTWGGGLQGQREVRGREARSGGGQGRGVPWQRAPLSGLWAPHHPQELSIPSLPLVRKAAGSVALTQQEGVGAAHLLAAGAQVGTQETLLQGQVPEEDQEGGQEHRELRMPGEGPTGWAHGCGRRQGPGPGSAQWPLGTSLWAHVRLVPQFGVQPTGVCLPPPTSCLGPSVPSPRWVGGVWECPSGAWGAIVLGGPFPEPHTPRAPYPV